MDKNIFTTNPVQLWLNTPIGAYAGSPNWGNNFEILLGENMNDLDIFLLQVLEKMKFDLKEDFNLVQYVEILEKSGEGSFIIVVAYLGEVVGVVELTPR